MALVEITMAVYNRLVGKKRRKKIVLINVRHWEIAKPLGDADEVFKKLYLLMILQTHSDIDIYIHLFVLNKVMLFTTLTFPSSKRFFHSFSVIHPDFENLTTSYL